MGQWNLNARLAKQAVQKKADGYCIADGLRAGGYHGEVYDCSKEGVGQLDL
jgi:hypothetical protein